MMRRKITALVLAVVLVVQTMALGLVTVDALIEQKSVTVTKEWNDKEDHSNDVVTVQLLANGIPATDENGDKIEVDLTSDKPTYTFTELPAYQLGTDSKLSRPMTYTVKETKINGEDVQQLVNDGKYKKPQIKETNEEVQESDITYQRYVNCHGDIEDGEKYAIVICNYVMDGVYRDKNLYSTIDSSMNVTDVEYNGDDTYADNGTTYYGYFENVTDENLWTVSEYDNEKYSFSNGNKKLAIRKNQDGEYDYVVTDKDNDPNEITQFFVGNPYETYIMARIDNGYLYLTNAGNGTFKGVKDGSVWGATNSYGCFVKKVDVTETIETGHKDITITNEEIVRNTSMTVKKEWADQKDHSKDNVTVQLTKKNANGGFDLVAGQIATLDESNKWQYTFENLREKDKDGNENVYYVQETKINNEPIEDLIKAGKYEKPEMKVTKKAEESTKETEVEKEYWVKAPKDENGAYQLEDGTYAIVSNDWNVKENDEDAQNLPIALTADHRYDMVKTEPINVQYGKVGEEENVEYIETVKDIQQWDIKITDEENNLMKISNDGMNLTFVASSYYNDWHDYNKYILSTVESYKYEDYTRYQPEFRLLQKENYGMMTNILASRIYERATEADENDNYRDIWMYMKEGNVPTDYCTDEFAGNFEFYKKVTVKETEQEVVKTPEEVTITNKAVTPKETPKVQEKTKAVDTGDNNDIVYMASLMMLAMTGFVVLTLRKKYNS